MTGWRKRQVMEMALHALETKGEHHPRVYQAITALREALAEQDMPKIGCVNHDCAKCKAEQPAQQQSVYCLNCEELSKQVKALKLCLEVERGFREQEQPAQQEPVAWLTEKRYAELHTAQRTEERNFCPRCGKRAGDYIHTCTPPQD